MPRVRTLAVTLGALALAAVVLAGLAPAGLRWPARLGLLFLLPMASGIAATILLPRSAKRLGSSARVLGTGRYALLVGAAVAIELAALAAACGLGWIDVSTGDGPLSAWRLAALPLALPLVIAAATLGTEWALHARLWEVAARESSPEAASFLAVGLGTALALPAVVPGFEVAAPAAVGAAVAVAGLREAIALRLFRAGGLFVAGAYRGVLVAIEGFGLADAAGFWRPVARYVSSVPAAHSLRVLGAAAALALVLAATRRRPAIA